VPYKEIAKLAKKTDRTLRYLRKPVVRPLKKVGKKPKMDRKSFYHLIHSIQTGKTKTLKEMSEYVFQQTGLVISITAIFRVLKKIKYSYQVIPYRHPQQKSNLAEVIDFIEKVNNLPTRQLLSTDESGHPLNLASRRG
jgi:transposase